MKNAQRYLAIVAAILLLASCASGPQFLQLKPVPEGEARLTDIRMPDYVREDLPYDVILSIDSEETPKISRVCFRWVTAEISSNSPSLNCYAMGDTFGTGGPCTPWTSTAGPASSPFCVQASEMKTDVPGRLIVRIRPVDLKTSYNMLEGQVEYISNGKVRLTNAVRAPVTVDK